MAVRPQEERMTGAHFRALRTYLGYSVREIAEYFDVSLSSARAWDKGVYSPPAGIIDELEELDAATDDAVDYLVRHYSKSQIEWPMEIPRTPDEFEDWLPAIAMPGPVTVDWWKMVGMRVCKRVPGLTLDWV